MSYFSIFLDVQQFLMNALIIIRVLLEIERLRKQKTADSRQSTAEDDEE
jgi:hypothetical protein